MTFDIGHVLTKLHEEEEEEEEEEPSIRPTTCEH
jgi:hypothetical protein